MSVSKYDCNLNSITCIEYCFLDAFDVFLFARYSASSRRIQTVKQTGREQQTLYLIGQLKNRKRMIFIRATLFIRVSTTPR